MALLAHELLLPSAGEPTHWCLVLHGLGDSRRGWAPVAPMIGVPRLGFALADAPNAYGPGFSWFDILGFDRFEIDERAQARSRELLGALIDHLLATRGIPPERLFLMGFSQGCLMVLDTALRSDRRFAGIVAISGFLTRLDDFPAQLGTAAKAQRILWTHGRYDSMIPVDAVRPQMERVRGLGVPLTWSEYDKDHGLDPDQELADIRAFLTQGMAPSPGVKPARR